MGNSIEKVYVNYATSNTVFATGETIRVSDRDITGKVVYFSNTSSGVLIISELNKLLQANDVVPEWNSWFPRRHVCF